MRPTLLLMMMDGPAHGYDLSERMGEYGIADIDPSLIYRALRGMEEDGLVQSDWDEEKTQGPPRRVYSITMDGQDALAFYMDEMRVTRDRIDQLIDKYQTYATEKETNKQKKGDT